MKHFFESLKFLSPPKTYLSRSNVSPVNVSYPSRSEDTNDTNDEDFDDEPEFVDNDDEDEIEEEDDEFDDDDPDEDPDFKSAAAVKSAQRISTVKGPPKRKREARQVSRRPRKKLKKSRDPPARPRPPTPER